MSALPESLPACLQDEGLIGRLCERAGAGRWGVELARFARALEGAIASRFPGVSAAVAASAVPAASAASPMSAAAATSAASAASADVGANVAALDPAAVERFLEGLHLEDLALAVACADGHEPAWDHFVSTYRADLRRAAAAIAGADHADDLADTLLGELFGVDARGGARRSLFLYFHGRSRLSTWLRAILAQRQVDRVRASRRTVSIDALNPAEGEATREPGRGRDAERALSRDGVGLGSASATGSGIGITMPRESDFDPDRRRLVSALQLAIDTALASLDANERLRLTCYHVDGMTLAEMGRMFREHEATASRKLTRIRTRVRASVDEFLSERAGLKPAQIRLSYEYALEAGGLDMRALASAAAPATAATAAATAAAAAVPAPDAVPATVMATVTATPALASAPAAAPTAAASAPALASASAAPESAPAGADSQVSASATGTGEL